MMKKPKPGNHIIIAIDGYSSTGKSTVAKALAKKLGYTYIDTGAMYRAVTWYALENGWVGDGYFDKEALTRHLPDVHLHFRKNPDSGIDEIYLNGKNIERDIRGARVSSFVSPVAAVPEVRRFLVAQQRKMGAGKAVVMDGRDIGSVVFPDAEIKFFLTASPEVRAKRRWLEMKEKGEPVPYDKILQNIIERDHIDSTREDSPLVRTPDAIVIDVSTINREEQFDRMYREVEKILVAQKDKGVK